MDENLYAEKVHYLYNTCTHLSGGFGGESVKLLSVLAIINNENYKKIYENENESRHVASFLAQIGIIFGHH